MNGELDEVTSFGDCAGIPMDSGPVCESCGVPLIGHLGLIGTCAELQRVTTERDELRAQIAERRVVVPDPAPDTVASLSAVASPERAVRSTLSWVRRAVRAIDPATEVVVSRDGLDDLREQLRTAKADLVQTRLSCQRMPHEVAEHVNALRDIATTQHWSASDLREAIEREVERFAKLGEVQE